MSIVLIIADGGSDISIGRGTGYELEGLGSIPGDDEILLVAKTSLKSTQSLGKWIWHTGSFPG